MSFKSVGTLLALALASMPVLAQTTPDISIVNTITQSINVAAGSLIMPKAIAWLGSFMALQFVLTNFGLLKSGADIEAVIGKLIGSLTWFGFCFYLLNNGPDFISAVGDNLLDTFAPNLPSPGSIITSTLAICSALAAAIVVTGTSVVGTGNSAVAQVLILITLAIFSVGLFMAIKILMISLELALVVMLSPLSFSLLGLNALKDQGIAPLKSLISLAYRIILLGILCTAFAEVGNTAATQLESIRWTDPTKWADAIKVILATLAAYPIIAYFVYKSDAIAATLASGSTNMGTADVASAAAMGAAAGAAIATGGASMAAGAAKAPQSMADFMKSLVGSGASVSNASSRGAGPEPIGPAPAPPSSSLASGMSSGQNANNKPPVRPTTASTGTSSSKAAVGTAPTSPKSYGLPAHEMDNLKIPANSSPASEGNSGATPDAAAQSETTVALTPASAAEFATPANATARSGRAAAPAAPAPSRSAVESPSNKPPVRPAAADTGNGPEPITDPTRPSSGGSGANAGIGLPQSPLEKRVDDLVDALNAPKKPGFKEHVGNVNERIASEQASTHISINTHQTD